MALLNLPAAAQDNVTQWNAATINQLYSDLYGSLGTTIASGGTGQGTLDWTNLSLTANIRATQVADQAVVCGNATNPGVQAITRPTSVSGANTFLETAGGGWSPDLTASDIQTSALVGSAQSVVMGAGKSVLKLTSAAAASLSLITGGYEGQKITVVLADANTTVNHTATNTLNSIHLNRKANVVGDAGMCVIQLTYSAALTGTGQWWEI